MKILYVVAGALIVALSYAVISHLWTTSRGKEMDDAALAQAPFEHVELSFGPLHYRWQGPENGPVVVMVHGFSTPLFIFEQNATALAAAGFRVLRFDHYGRGWSGRPDSVYDTDFYDGTLVELLDAMSLQDPVHLVGLSMGGIISTTFAARHPERVKTLTLLVSAGLDLVNPKPFGGILDIPLIGLFIWHRVAPDRFSTSYDAHMQTLPEDSRLQGDVSTQFLFKGTAEAMLRTFRNLPMSGQDERFLALAETNIPTLAIFGDADDTVAISSAQRLGKLVPDAKIVTIEGGGHGLNFERHNEVSPLLVDWLQSH